MKTNFATEKHFVLSNDENKIISIIKAETGLFDIKYKIEQSILDDECVEHVFLLDKNTITEAGQTIFFSAVVVDFTEESQTKKYKLTESLIY